MSDQPQAVPKCVQCRRKPQDAGYKPFCSKRCADVDLNRWLSDGYAIPAVEADLSSDGEGQDEDS
jgi:endogenous inhibitor of DNA gyrase (YacG/DUF329 family)